jgi:hypothetical protein
MSLGNFLPYYRKMYPALSEIQARTDDGQNIMTRAWHEELYFA